MEQQNASSHPLLPPGFTNPSFASTFSGITPGAGNVSNPLLASTLHHLQELSAAQGAAGLLPNSSQLTLGSQFAAELNNIAAVGWPPAPNANAAWIEQAKVAAILPMYTVFSAGSLKPNEAAAAAALDPGEIELTMQNSAVANSTVFPSPVMPINTGIFPSRMEDNVHKIGSQPSTPQQRSQQQHVTVGSAQSSPASAMLVIDRQPGSIQSHCSTEMRPCSTSSMGPSSVPNHSSVGSVDHLPSSAGSAPMPESSGTAIRPCSQQSSSSYTMLRMNDQCSAQSPAQVAAVPALPRNSTVQQRIFDPAATNHPIELRTGPTGLPSSAPVGASSEVNQTSASANQPASGTPHENGADGNNLLDLPWSSIDLADIDLFGGPSVGEKDVMRSVLDEMDPTVVHRLFLMNEPSTSAKLPPNALQLITPKIREKIKLRREKELADADKELDRLLSLVAKKDAISTPISKIPKLFPALDPVLITSRPDDSDDHKISLSPVQFTPPDSPTPSTSANAPTCNFFFPSSSTSSHSTSRPSSSSRNAVSPMKSRFVFMPSTEKKNKSNKIPVYKQKAKGFFQPVIKTEEHTPDDAYSFTDDEEDSKPLPSGATVSEMQLREPKQEVEVAQRLARANSTHHELKTKTGSDESQSQQDLWRHVVPKKRHSAALERPSVPSTPLLPPASVSEHRMESSSNQKIAEPQTVADLLLRRKQHRSSFGFLKTKCLDDQETAKNEKQKQETEQPTVITIRPEPKEGCENGAQTEQPLPKLLIRLPRRSIDDSALVCEKPKKKKKRKKKDSDQEWVGSEKKRKKKKKKRKHKHHHHKKKRRHESDECEEEHSTKQDEQWNVSENTNKETTVFSKKRRLIMHWNEKSEENLTDSEYYRDRNSFASFDENDGHNANPESSQHSVLSKFRPVDGHLTKGTFVVCKSDILKEDCPLWRVDNQNLLQKYPPFILDGKIAYKNSSTYSGWCDQIADSYIVVRVRFIKHTRSECIIEPEMSLLDMFPAVSTEYEEQDAVNSEATSEQKEDLFAGDPIRQQMVVYVKAMLNHALDMTFLQAMKQRSDWNYLCALNGIDKLNQERKEKVQLQVKWIQRYLDLLHFYSSCVICDSEGSGLSCQACGCRGVEKVVQLFCNEGYDYDTLEAEEVCYTGSGSPLHAVEYLVCSSCAKLSRVYHKLHHMRYILLKKCEDKLEKVSAGNAELSSEAVAEACMNDVKWLRSVVNEYADLWRRIEMNDC